LDVPEAILALIEKTEPTAMHWINRIEATEIGLSTPVVESSSTPAVESSSTPAVESSSPPPGVRRSPAWLWDAQRGYSRQWEQ
jgi:hypothetical protein